MPMLKETYNFDKKLYSETKKPKSMIPDEAKETYEYLAKLRFLIWILDVKDDEYKIDFIKDLGEEKRTFVTASIYKNKSTGDKTIWQINYEHTIFPEPCIRKNVLMILKQSLKR